ncbi:hypothetical protein [Aeromicrobium sp.]|uniref:hypothetical protein n=1 Tax=Aeromicrobium sp. TaxID=1871063 RepID=UPI002FC8EDFA
MRRPTVSWATMILLVAAVLGGCQGDKENDMDVQQRAEAAAEKNRQHVDDLVERLGGVGAKVVGDDIIDCDPQDPDAGLLHNYTVRFTAPEGAETRLKGEVADALEAEGWTVRRDPDTEREISLRFLRDGTSLGAKLAVHSDGATAGGSSGCVR